MGGDPKRPMLALPMGEDDYNKGDRMRFMRSCLPILIRLGWTIGVEFKGPSITGWGEECLKELQSLGGRAVWHLPNDAAMNLPKGLDNSLIRTVTEAYRLNQDTDLRIEAITMHLAPVVTTDPPYNAGNERYNSPISAEEMLAHIQGQVGPLTELNKWAGGNLQIENLDMVYFRDGGTKTPTYLALQTGCAKDLLWLSKQAGVGITFDSEHFFGARKLLARDFLPHVYEQGRNYDFADLASHYPPGEHFKSMNELAEITGYWLSEGLPPTALDGLLCYDTFIAEAKPRLFHLGGSTQSVDSKGRIDTHLPNFSDSAKGCLRMELQWTMKHPDVIGCVVEVCGRLQPEKYSEWSPRPYDDEVAKMEAFLYVMNEIETFRDTRYVFERD